MKVHDLLNTKLKQVASKANTTKKELEDIFKELQPLEDSDHDLEVFIDKTAILVSGSFGHFKIYSTSEGFNLDFYLPWQPRRQFQRSTEEDECIIDLLTYNLARKLHEQSSES